MFREFLRFELRYQLRSPLPWLIALLLAFLAFLAISTDQVQIGGSIGNVNRNAPSVILNILGTFSVLGMVGVLLLIAQPLLRDADLRTEELFFSAPLRKGDYLWGRALGGALATLGIYVVIALVMVIAAFMPWLDPQRVGPFTLLPYLWTFGVVIVPNLIFIGALLCLLAVATRRLLLVFLGSMAVLVLWMIAGSLLSDIQYDTIGGLIDPFGARTVDRVMRYWSATERNTLVPDVSGLLLLNRVIWLSVSAVMLVATHSLFRTQRPGSRKRKRARADAQAAPAELRAAVVAPAHARSFGGAATARQFLHQLMFDTASVLRSLPFLILLGLGAANLLAGAGLSSQRFGTSFYPVTAQMLESIRGSYEFLLYLIVAYYAGEVIWRERDARVAEATDASPVPNWLPLFAKTGALFAVVLVFMAAGVLVSVGYQLWHGYTNLELGLYLRGTLLGALPFGLMAVASVFLQVMSNQKFIGYALFILVFALQLVLTSLHFEHNLYVYGGTPALIYSDMNGYGHLLQGWAWFEAYWYVFAALLLVIAAAFWVRGAAPSWRGRWTQAMRALRGPQGGALAVLALAFVAIGSWIFYNTNVITEYLPSDVVLDRQANYEKQYRKYQDLAQPRIVDVRADVDIYPQERRVQIRGHYRLVNKHDAPIGELHVSMDPRARLHVTAPTAARLVVEDLQSGYRIYRLAQPLAAGASLDFDFTVDRADRGFTNEGMAPSGAGGDIRSQLNANGTFFNSMTLFPHLGYNKEVQIIDRTERRKRGLGDVPRAAKLEDESARGSMGFADADWINFETVVSTSADQIALAPGYLQREWTQGGRRYFHYKWTGRCWRSTATCRPAGKYDAVNGAACRSRSTTTPSIHTTSIA